MASSVGTDKTAFLSTLFIGKYGTQHSRQQQPGNIFYCIQKNKYHYSFIFTFLVKETTQANKEYEIFGPF